MDGEAEAGVEREMKLFDKFRALREMPIPQGDFEARLLPALDQAREILMRYNHPGQASYMQRLIDAVRLSDRKAYSTLLDSVEMWGGAGAVWECDISGTATAQADRREFRKSIIEIAQQMRNLGTNSARAQEIADIFNGWNEQNL